MHREGAAVLGGDGVDPVAEQDFPAFVQAYRRVGVTPEALPVAVFDRIALELMAGGQFLQPPQDIERQTGRAVILKAQVMRGLDSGFRDDDPLAEGVPVDHLEEVGHAWGALHLRIWDWGLRRQRRAQEPDQFGHQLLVAGPVFDRDFLYRPLRPVLPDDDLAHLVEPPDPRTLGVLPVQEGQVEGRGAVHHLRQPALEVIREVRGDERANQQFRRGIRGRRLHRGVGLPGLDGLSRPAGELLAW